MHPDQIPITAELVRRMVGAQLSRWANLPVTEVDSAGTVNALYRVGPDLVARLPLQRGDVGARRAELSDEIDAAERLLTVSPVATPEPVATGEPMDPYPLPWCVYRWIPGIVATGTDAAGSHRFAAQLAGFVRAVRSLPTQGRTFQGSRRGGVLTQHDEYVASGLRHSSDMIDTEALDAVWSRLRETPRAATQTWTHGDLMPGNLLVEGDDLTGVIDVGQLAVADPALDLQPAWNLMTRDARETYRQSLGCDDEEWDRGKGWALAQAIGCLWYYRDTNPVMSQTALRTLQALLDDA
ncbi:MAG: aminoglycoside phosphotransferase family protein [Ornithinibacter sp.]